MAVDESLVASLVGMVMAFGALIVSLRKSQSEARKTGAEAVSIETDADARRDMAVSEATATLVKTYEARLELVEERNREMECDRESRWKEDELRFAELEQASRKDQASCMSEVRRLQGHIAIMEEEIISLRSVNRRLWTGVNVLLRQISGLGAHPDWIPPAEWQDAMNALDEDSTPTPPSRQRQWSEL